MKIIKKISTTILFMLVLLLSVNSRAGIPNTDYANLAQGLYENLTAVFNHEELMAYFQAKTEHLASLMGVEIDTANNQKANAISRINKAEEDIYNMSVAMEDMPSSNACQDFSFSIQLDDVVEDMWCDFLGASEETQQTATASIAFDQDDIGELNNYDIESDYRGQDISKAIRSSYRHKKNKDIVDSLKNNAPDLFDSNQNIDPDEIEDTPLSAKNIIAGDTYTLSEDQYESAINFVYLIAPPYESSIAKEIFSPVISVNEMEMAARKSVPNLILNSLISERYSNGGKSKLELLMSFADEKYSPYEDQENSFVETMTTSDVFSPHSLLRDVAILTAFQVKMSVEKYDRSMKSEMISATKLAARLNIN